MADVIEKEVNHAGFIAVHVGRLNEKCMKRQCTNIFVRRWPSIAGTSAKVLRNDKKSLFTRN